MILSRNYCKGLNYERQLKADSIKTAICYSQEIRQELLSYSVSVEGLSSVMIVNETNELK